MTHGQQNKCDREQMEGDMTQPDTIILRISTRTPSAMLQNNEIHIKLILKQ